MTRGALLLWLRLLQSSVERTGKSTCALSASLLLQATLSSPVSSYSLGWTSSGSACVGTQTVPSQSSSYERWHYLLLFRDEDEQKAAT